MNKPIDIILTVNSSLYYIGWLKQTLLNKFGLKIISFLIYFDVIFCLVYAFWTLVITVKSLFFIMKIIKL